MSQRYYRERLFSRAMERSFWRAALEGHCCFYLSCIKYFILTSKVWGDQGEWGTVDVVLVDSLQEQLQSLGRGTDWGKWACKYIL